MSSPNIREIVEVALKNLQRHKAIRGWRYEFTDEQAAEVVEKTLTKLEGFRYPAAFMLVDAIENVLVELLASYRVQS